MEFGLRPLGFMECFCKTTIIRQLRKWNESKIEKNIVKKPLGFCMILYVWFWVCECVEVCAYACMGYSCV